MVKQSMHLVSQDTAPLHNADVIVHQMSLDTKRAEIKKLEERARQVIRERWR